ncbi:MAG: LysR family transcriptional regulator [Sneathiellales bacterium]|nr:LysR family transcriptional regulator [Sneathiellales bacterium]
MNLAQLRYCVTAEQTRSFSKAAEACCITQPTLSNGIAALEKELGGKIFKRTTRSISLTRFGHHILPFIQSVLDAREELEKTAQNFHQPEGQILRMGLSPLIDMSVFSKALQHLKAQNLWSDIFIKQCLIGDMRQRLEEETIDFALLPKHSGSSFKKNYPLYEEPLFYLPPDDGDLTLSRKNRVFIEELADQPLILTNGCGLSDVIEDLFKEANLTLKPYPGQAISYTVVAEWADLGIAGSILPKSQLPSAPQKSFPLYKSQDEPAYIYYQAVTNIQGAEPERLNDTLNLITKTLSSLANGQVEYLFVS